MQKLTAIRLNAVDIMTSICVYVALKREEEEKMKKINY